MIKTGCTPLQGQAARTFIRAAFHCFNRNAKRGLSRQAAMHPRRLTEPASSRISSSDAVESRSLLQADADEYSPQEHNFASPNSAEGHDIAPSARHLPASDLTFRSLLAGGIVGVRCLSSPGPRAAYRLSLIHI